MAIYPKAQWKPLPENSTQSSINPTQVILHTAVDAPGPTRLENYFGRADVTVESHFWIENDGNVVQMMDTDVRADANRFANVRAISIETEDDGNPIAYPWTDAQVKSIEELLVWCHEVHGIPLTLVTSPTGPGIGWHSMWGFVDPIKQTGALDNPWSTVKGKICPGKTRINQLINVIMPAVAAGNPIGSVVMTPEESAKLVDALYQAILHRKADVGGRKYWVETLASGVDPTNMLWSFLINAGSEVGDLQQRIADLEATVKDLVKVASTPTIVQNISGATTEQVIEELILRLKS